ncbi:uncharacterized protein LOC112568212 [Pomacea canaliculata]|uniref:uncharacterized protein LOC112568212 n=1 Tax=Pomacea canaliculata TaxID=400727 RepID=UPI000D73686A|nr:uncharacterized protein LOC112568212 [Pomacea canaliculata]
MATTTAYLLVFVTWCSLYCGVSFASYVSSNIPRDLSRYKIINAKEKSVVHLTFNISDDTCQNTTKMCVIKLTTYDTGLVTDICTTVIDNGTCTETDMNKSCACENSATGSVINYSGSVTFSESDYKIYFWNSIIGNSSETMKPEEIMFLIRESETKQENETRKEEGGCSCLGQLLIIVPCACLLIDVTIGVICLIQRRKNKATAADRDSRPEELVESNKHHDHDLQKEDWGVMPVEPQGHVPKERQSLNVQCNRLDQDPHPKDLVMTHVFEQNPKELQDVAEKQEGHDEGPTTDDTYSHLQRA